MICNRRIFLVVVMALLSSVFFVSCSQVDIEDFNSDSSTKVRFSVDWKNVMSSDGETPDSLTVYMNRIQNITLRYVRKIDSDGNILQTHTEDSSAESAGLSEFRNGYYQIAAVAADDPEDYEVPLEQIFKKERDSTAVSMKEIYVKVRQMSDEEKEQVDFLDFNFSYPLIRAVKPIYIVRSSTSGSLISPKGIGHDGGEEVQEISLVPEPVTRKISFSVQFNVGEGVVVEKMYGVISGVPQQIRMMSGIVSNTGTGKVYFPMEQKNSVHVGDRLYEGSANVLGLFPSGDADFITGPGILNVVVYACAEESGIEFHRVYHASLNLKEEIEKAKIMLQVEGRSGFVIGGTDDVRIDVIRGLRLTRRMVIDGMGQGLEKWEENITDGEGGMNPEI